MHIYRSYRPDGSRQEVAIKNNSVIRLDEELLSSPVDLQKMILRGILQ